MRVFGEGDSIKSMKVGGDFYAYFANITSRLTNMKTYAVDRWSLLFYAFLAKGCLFVLIPCVCVCV